MPPPYTEIIFQVSTTMTATPPTWLNTFSMRWIAVVAWMIVIFMFSTDHFSDARTTAPLFRPSLAFAIRKLAHWAGYFILAVLLVRTLNGKSTGIIPKYRVLVSVILAVIYAGLDEWHQSFLRSREATARDVLIDGVGAVCGALSYYTYVALRHMKTAHVNTHGRA
jgi:VanZ family protein